MKFLKDSIITVFSKGVHFVLLFVISIITARYLGPDGKGTLSLVLLAPTLLITFGDLGIGGANVYMIGKRKYSPNDVLGNSLLLALVISFALFFLFWITSPFHYLVFKGVDKNLLLIAVVSIPFSLFGPYAFTIFLGLTKIARYSLSKLFEHILFLLFIILFLLILQKSVNAAVLAYVLATSGAVIGILWLLRPVCKINLSFNKKLLKETLDFGIKSHLGEIGGFLNRRLDVLLVNYFCGVEQVGLYAVGVSLGELLWYLPSALSSLLFSRTATTDTKEANDFTPIFLRNMIFILVIGAILLFALAKTFVRIAYGEAFMPSVKPLWILLPGIVMYGISRMVAADLFGRGKPIISTIASVASLAVNIGLNLFFIPKWGIAGAALASTISYSVAGIIILFVFIKLSGNTLRNTVLITKEDFKNLGDVIGMLWRRAFNKRG